MFYFSRGALELKHTETKEPLKQPWNVFAGSDMQFCAWTPPTAETFRCFIFYVLCDGWNQKQFVDSKRNLLYCFVFVLLQLRGTIISFSNVCGSGLGFSAVLRIFLSRRKAAVVLWKAAEGLRFDCSQYGSFAVFAVYAFLCRCSGPNRILCEMDS